MASLTGYKFEESLRQYLWRFHRDIYADITVFGHVELLDDIMPDYFEWVKTDEAAPYLKGGEFYKEAY